MDNYGPFAQKAQRLERENDQLVREIEMLKMELYDKSKFIDDVISELNITKEQCKRLQNEAQTAQTIARNYKISDNDLNQCCCNCPGCVWKKNPIRQLEHAEYKLKDILSMNESMKQRINSLERENEEWENFCYRLYGISSSALQYFPEYPKTDSEGRRRIVATLVRKMCKYGGKEIDEHAAFDALKKKYIKTTNSIKTIHEESDRLHDILSPDDCYYYSYRKQRRDGEITCIERKVFENTFHPMNYPQYETNSKKEYLNTKFTTNRFQMKENKEKNYDYVSPNNITAMLNQTENSIQQKSKQLNDTHTSFEQDVKQLHTITKQIKTDYKSMINSRSFENASNSALNINH